MEENACSRGSLVARSCLGSGMGYAVTLFCPLPGVQRDDAWEQPWHKDLGTTSCSRLLEARSSLRLILAGAKRSSPGRIPARMPVRPVGALSALEPKTYRNNCGGGSFEDLFSFLLFFLILMVSWAKGCIVTVSKAGWLSCRRVGKRKKNRP